MKVEEDKWIIPKSLGSCHLNNERIEEHHRENRQKQQAEKPGFKWIVIPGKIVEGGSEIPCATQTSLLLVGYEKKSNSVAVSYETPESTSNEKSI